MSQKLVIFLGRTPSKYHYKKKTVKKNFYPLYSLNNSLRVGLLKCLEIIGLLFAFGLIVTCFFNIEYIAFRHIFFYLTNE